MNRQGPKPLALHISLAGAYFQNNEKAHEKLSDMINGIQLYQKNDFARQGSNYKIIWQCSQTTLRQISPNNHHLNSGTKNICLLVPSIINGSEILDLSPQRSLAQYMIAQGMDCYILDWGDLRADDQDITLDKLISQRLIKAVYHLKEIYPQANIHALGYCMGGAMALGAAFILAQNNSKCFATLTLLASPWNFHVGHMVLLNKIKYWAPAALASAHRSGYLGADYLQSLFASVDPVLTQSKFSSFARMDQSSERAKIFIAVEDWLNDGRDLPENIAQECIVDWFLNNAPATGNWQLANMNMDPRIIDIPVLIVASRKDRLVEFESATDLKNYIKHADIYQPDCGHIGMIAGEKSISQVWHPIAQWIKSPQSA